MHDVKKWGSIILLVTLFLLFLFSGSKKEEEDFTLTAKNYMAGKVVQQMLDIFLPFFSFSLKEEIPTTAGEMLSAKVLKELPIYGFYKEQAQVYLTHEKITELLLQEGRDEDTSIEENDYEAKEIKEEKAKQDMVENSEKKLSLEDLFLLENGAIDTQFVPRIKNNEYDWESLKDYATLISTFYTIDANTMIGSDQLDVDQLNSKDLKISKTDESPQILIYHTHSREAFSDSVAGDASQTIVGVGDRLAQILTETYGFGVLHHTAEYDTVRDDAYAKSLPAIEALLKENPSIQVIIDLHRDSGVKDVHRTIEIDGRKTATFMLFNGLSRTKKTGNISYLKNSNLEDNLAFSFQMQVKAGEYYPGITRKIYLKGYRYNMHLKPRTLLIELGDNNSTVEEAMNTCEPLAHILNMVLTGEE